MRYKGVRRGDTPTEGPLGPEGGEDWLLCAVRWGRKKLCGGNLYVGRDPGIGVAFPSPKYFTVGIYMLDAFPQRVA